MRVFIYILLISFLAITSNAQACLEYPGIPVIGENHQIFQDREGLVWVNTEHGLFCFDGKSIEEVRFEKDSITDPFSNWYLSTTQDQNGNLWFGHRGKVLTFYNKKEDTFKRYSSKDGYPGIRAWQVLEYQSSIWIADESGLIKFDPNKNEWKHFSYLHLFKKGPVPRVSVIRKILPQAKEGRFWLATNAGLMEFDIDTEQFTPIKMTTIKNDQRGIDWLLIDLYKSKESILCSSWGGGLLSYNFKSKQWSQYFSPLKPNNFIPLQLEALNDQEILCTGFETPPFIFNLNTSTFSAYEHPFIKQQGSARYSDASLLDNAGFLWISNDINICRKKVKEGHQEISKPFVKKIYINNKLVEKSGLLYNKELDYNEPPKSIRFEFNNVQQGNKLNYTYQYQLKGHDREWIDCGHNTSVNYSSISGGTYSFSVRSTLDKKDWLETLPVQIQIKKRFYAKSWFIGLMLAGLACLIGGFYYFNLQRIREKEALKTAHNKELLEMEMMALRAQMNPHFMFNSLNSINQFIMTNEPRVASKYLSKFAQLMRSILNNSKEQEVSLEDELKMISLYMEMEALRFKEKFDQNITIDPALNPSNILIQPMIIQPYIENAIWHGIMSLDKLGKIVLSIYKKEDRLICEIEDNGIGRAAAELKNKKSLIKKKSMGMQITSKRMELAEVVNQIKSTLKVIDKKDKAGNAIGTKVILSLPFKTKSNS